jgi:beta-lactam-binding protein with PASTA domain
MKSQFLKFLISKVFFKNLLIAIGITLVILIVIQLGLRLYTEHGKEINVPNFSGMQLTEVDQLCYKDNLLWTIVDSVYNRDSAGGIVMDQYPLAGSRVKRNRKIFITTNAYYPETILMPKAVDMPYRQAERLLQSNGLILEDVEYEPYFAPKYVLEQKYEGEVIEPGTPIQKGSGITLVVGQGLSNERAIVPDLILMSKDSAMKVARGSFFNLGAVSYDYSIEDGEDSAQARVYRQFPNENQQKARLGSSIDIWLTIDSLILQPLDSARFPADSLLQDSLRLEGLQ